MANRPNGNRVIVAPTIGGKKRYCRCKSGTATLLGLAATTDIPKGKRDAVIRGAKGTKSYTLFLKKAESVGGATVRSVDFPVPGEVKLRDFYKWAKSKGKLAGMRSPDGISYYWAKAAKSGGGGIIPGGGGLDLGDVGDLVDGIVDVIKGGNVQLELLEGIANILGD
ncbi:MAG TPA: hypothetical protein V6D07_09750 [Trichocoleus sp.]